MSQINKSSGLFKFCLRQNHQQSNGRNDHFTVLVNLLGEESNHDKHMVAWAPFNKERIGGKGIMLYLHGADCLHGILLENGSEIGVGCQDPGFYAWISPCLFAFPFYLF